MRAYSYLPHSLLIASNTSAPPPYAPPTERVLVVLRDGRNLVGMLRSFDQFCKLPRPTRRMFIDLRATQPCWASVLSIPSALLRGTPCLLPCCLVLRARTLSFASVSNNAPLLSPSCFPGWIQCRLECVSASVTYKRGSAFTPLTTPPSPLPRTHTHAAPHRPPTFQQMWCWRIRTSGTTPRGSLGNWSWGCILFGQRIWFFWEKW